ncbi:ClpXP protease specificity-enhancing factor, partial [Xanthomonas oryzae pv. oryzae]
PDDIPGTSNEPPDPGAPPPSAPTPDEPPSGGKRPHLRVVK